MGPHICISNKSLIIMEHWALRLGWWLPALAAQWECRGALTYPGAQAGPQADAVRISWMHSQGWEPLARACVILKSSWLTTCLRWEKVGTGVIKEIEWILNTGQEKKRNALGGPEKWVFFIKRWVILLLAWCLLSVRDLQMFCKGPESSFLRLFDLMGSEASNPLSIKAASV